MFETITYYMIGKLPLIVYLGIATFSLFFITAMIAVLRRKGKTKISVMWHYRFAYISLCFGIIHGLLVILAYF